jgi:hypothetical protein
LIRIFIVLLLSQVLRKNTLLFIEHLLDRLVGDFIAGQLFHKPSVAHDDHPVAVGGDLAISSEMR